MKTIKEFCDKHNACRGGREWALTHCKDMNEVWQTARPEWLMWVATRNGVLTDSERRRFAVWSARQVQHLMTDERSLNAIDVADRHVNGAATDEELAAARAAATASADAAYAAYAAADAARAAARAASADAARAAAESAQAQWLRENTKPNFA